MKVRALNSDTSVRLGYRLLAHCTKIHYDVIVP